MRKIFFIAAMHVAILLGVSTAFADIFDEPLTLNDVTLPLKAPFRAALRDSSLLGPVVDLHFANTFNRSNAFGLEVDVGGHEYRIGGTWGHQFNQDHRIKLTAEYLAEEPDFKFLTGKDHTWLGQGAYAGTYEYLYHGAMLRTLDFSGYYAQAHSKDLSEKPFLIIFKNLRRAAGARTAGLRAGVGLRPWFNGHVDLALHYDRVRYAMRHEVAKNRSGLGGTVKLQQLLWRQWLVTGVASRRKPYDEYQLALSWLPSVRVGTRLILSAVAAHTAGNGPLSNDNRFGVEMTYSWGGRYGSLRSQQPGLAAWVMTPAARMSQVIVIRDQATVL